MTEQGKKEALTLLAERLDLGEVTVQYLPHSESWVIHLPDGQSIYGIPGEESYQSAKSQLLATISIRRQKFTGIKEGRWPSKT